ncbi:hypothetical protein CEUSTIGMA_g11207.t1 [Chlamydomonas eustigma]|uniref:PDZ domain-containing protein n=1 Tax=Chlamydomonas eustigma TaxID=1157962 RepID=A0A250XLL2_9CHLO|nr:hypothetical protein CEUSTIGMA_g11207.t1 [Chlamydomonas eustigma]|eukprot:GAX83782.1 hypothetical protein CEUSTIGMA_g11207.t1 [Chlamydomonas eustigma]
MMLSNLFKTVNIPLPRVNVVGTHSSRNPSLSKPFSTHSLHLRHTNNLQRPQNASAINCVPLVTPASVGEAQNGTTEEASTTLMFDLKANELQRSLLLEVLPEGKGQALIIVGVLEGSQADKAGIVPGQKILSISDPIRQGEMWSMGDRPSLRFFKDTLQAMRNKEVAIELSKAALYSARPEQAGNNINYADESRSVRSAGDFSTESGSSEDIKEKSTIGDKLEEQYKRTASQQRQVSEVQKRIAKRKEYMEEVSKRSDRGLIGWAVALFIGPAALILSVAYFSGFLDTMYINSLSAFK